MNFDELTDGEIEMLIALPKSVSNANARWKQSRGSSQKNYKTTGGDYLFRVYLRQNDFDQSNFSCGLSLVKPDGQHLTLLRCNGSNHPHGNIKYDYHIHRATEHAISSGKKPEISAEVTNEYKTLDGALYWIAQNANIKGMLDLKPDQSDLFTN